MRWKTQLVRFEAQQTLRRSSLHKSNTAGDGIRLAAHGVDKVRRRSPEEPSTLSDPRRVSLDGSVCAGRQTHLSYIARWYSGPALASVRAAQPNPIQRVQLTHELTRGAREAAPSVVQNVTIRHPRRPRWENFRVHRRRIQYRTRSGGVVLADGVAPHRRMYGRDHERSCPTGQLTAEHAPAAACRLAGREYIRAARACLVHTPETSTEPSM